MDPRVHIDGLGASLHLLLAALHMADSGAGCGSCWASSGWMSAQTSTASGYWSGRLLPARCLRGAACGR